MLASQEATAFAVHADDLVAVQGRLLLQQLQGSNAHCRYGRLYGFAAIRGPQEYRERVPLVEYEDVRPWVERMAAGEVGVLTGERPIAFFRTSGTLAAPKLVPVTGALVREKSRAFGIYWNSIYRAHPSVRGGRMIANFGDAGEAERTPGGVEILSETSFWSRRMRAVQGWGGWSLPAVVRTIREPGLRYYTVARLAMAGPLHAIMCLNPSTLLLLCRTIERHRPALIRGIHEGALAYPGEVEPNLLDRLAPYLQADPVRARQLEADLGSAHDLGVRGIWRDLELAVCWRSEIVQPYHVQLQPYLAGVPQRDYITQSSECILAIPLEDGSSGGVLAYTSHFYEFIPASRAEERHPPTLFAWELEAEGVYEVVVTTGGGLYRYRTGDCLRVREFRAGVPVLEFLYRKGKTASMTGEKLTEYQVMEASRRASAACGTAPAEFLCFPRSGIDPHYGVLLNWKAEAGRQTGEHVRRWLKEFDAQLKAVNAEYADKRDSRRLGVPVGLLIGGDAFEAYRRGLTRGRISDEQIKTGVLSRDLDLDHQLPVQRLVHAS